MDRDTRKWVGTIVGLLSFMGVANAVLLTSALKGHGADAEPEAYSRALKWGQTQDALERSHALGWKVTATVTGTGTDARLQLQALDPTGAPIALDATEATLIRPSNDRPVQTLHLTPSGTPGEYTAPVQISAPGLWELQGVLTRGSDHYFARLRMDVHDGYTPEATTL